MLIVLEGCDGTGKTTLAKLLQTCYNMEYIHCTAETPNNYEFFADIIKRSANTDIVCDRFFWGQFVYQKEEERHLTKDELFSLYTLMNVVSKRNRIILVEADPFTVRYRLDCRQENTDKSILDIMQGFRSIANESCADVPVYRYNTSTGEIERMGV